MKPLECKTNTLPILMHQMHISTTQVSSVLLRSENDASTFRLILAVLLKTRPPKTNYKYHEHFADEEVFERVYYYFSKLITYILRRMITKTLDMKIITK
jgi:hypothetical protein